MAVIQVVTPDNPLEDKERLLESGAHFVSEDHLDNGYHLVMMRDPRGFFASVL